MKKVKPNVKFECVTEFCYLGDTLGAGGDVKEAARARVEMCLGKVQGVISYPDSLE